MQQTNQPTNKQTNKQLHDYIKQYQYMGALMHPYIPARCLPLSESSPVRADDFDLILLSDCVYWESLFAPLVNTLRGTHMYSYECVMSAVVFVLEYQFWANTESVSYQQISALLHTCICVCMCMRVYCIGLSVSELTRASMHVKLCFYIRRMGVRL